MIVLNATIIFSVFALLIYICDTKKILKTFFNPYLIIIYLGLLTRIFFLKKYGYEPDINCFAGWADILYKHGLKNFYYLKDFFRDYPPGYMYILYILGHIKNIFLLSQDNFKVLLKMPAVISDIILCILLYKLFINKNKKINLALVLSLIYLLNPLIIFNSAIWGQVDSIYSLAIFLAIYFITQKKYLNSFISFIIAILIKPQALIFTPIFLYSVFNILVQNKFSKKAFYLISQYILCSGLILIALLIPFVNKLNFMPIINQYIKTLGSYPYASVNAFNIYMYLNLNWFDINHNKLFFLVLELLIILFISTFSLWFLIKSKSKAKYFFCAGLLNILVFNFSLKMHERYIYPALIFFLAAYFYESNKKYLLLYTGFSITGFINSFMVYQKFIKQDNTNIFCVTAQVFSITNIILAIIAIYFAKNIFILESDRDQLENNNINIKNNNALDLNILAAKNLEPEKKLAKLEKKDWSIIFIISLSYFFIAFFNLGNTKSPESFFLANKNINIIIDLGKTKNIKRIQILNGIRPDKKINLYSAIAITNKDNNKNNNFIWHLEKKIDLKSVSSVFNWHEENLNIKSRYLKLKFLDDETYIQEIAFRDQNNNILPIKLISKHGKELFDEQNLVPEKSNFMNSMYFDEVYHARTAYEFLHGLKVYEDTHPPLGKNFIALGIKLFGMTPFGWRFCGTLFGVLMLPVFYLLAKKIFSRTLWASIASILFAFDFMHFEQTRIATIDSYTVFFIILMYLAIYIYYNQDFFGLAFDNNNNNNIRQLVFCAIFSGLACACKWQGFYALFGLAIIFFSNIILAYKKYLFEIKAKNNNIKINFISRVANLISICLILIWLVFLPIYFSSYFLYIKTSGVKNFIDIIKNQNYMFNYHAFLKATHPFSSRYWQWILNLRPILFYNKFYSRNIIGAISCFSNPVICYGGLLGFFYCLSKISYRFNKDIFFMLIAYLSGLVPWIFIKRASFAYHYFPCVPFLILMFVYFLKDYAYPKYGNKILFITIFLAALLFFMFYPVISGMPVNKSYINKFLRWFDSWDLY